MDEIFFFAIFVFGVEDPTWEEAADEFEVVDATDRSELSAAAEVFDADDDGRCSSVTKAGCSWCGVSGAVTIFDG